MESAQYKEMVEVIKKYHAHQGRNADKVPYWHHLVSVSEILNNALIQSNELSHNKKRLEQILLAALGHDLYEDTSIKRGEIIKHFGKEVDELIWFLTNEGGDADRDAYLTKMAEAPEEAKLIKLSDLVENTICVAYGLHDLGSDWAHSFFLPIVEEMREEMGSIEFKRFPKTAQALLDRLEFSFSRLHENVKKFDQA
ncbi:MAG: hypothetical protein WCT32_05240 [Patescibacteria group bacterium]|jgi:(p)ppGpp synthase/HD superfamily hydrolase